MKVTELALRGPKLIELDLFGDARGFFVERFNEARFREHGLPTHFVQDNHSRSAPGVLRGLHLQTNPAQGKLVGCARGKIWDVAVDLRPESPTFTQHYATELTDLNGRLLWIPPGFAHGFCVLGEDPADVFYKVDALYAPNAETGILWSDPELKISWPLSHPIVSARDQELRGFAEYRRNFIDKNHGR
jgi:dTDP-4-dehydrorhamnose 3,5-epimerase